jgi:hypothetical protein
MTITTYQKLYESSVSFGMLRSLQAEESQSAKTLKINQLQTDIGDLKMEVRDMERKIQNFKQRENKRRGDVALKHRLEVQELTDTNNRMKDELQQLLSIPTSNRRELLLNSTSTIAEEDGVDVGAVLGEDDTHFGLEHKVAAN